MDEMTEITTKKKKKKKSKPAPKKDLTFSGIGVIFNEKKQAYELVRLLFDPGTKQAVVTSVEYLADSNYRAHFEIKKMLAYGDIVPAPK